MRLKDNIIYWVKNKKIIYYAYNRTMIFEAFDDYTWPFSCSKPFLKYKVIFVSIKTEKIIKFFWH